MCHYIKLAKYNQRVIDDKSVFFSDGVKTLNSLGSITILKSSHNLSANQFRFHLTFCNSSSVKKKKDTLLSRHKIFPWNHFIPCPVHFKTISRRLMPHFSKKFWSRSVDLPLISFQKLDMQQVCFMAIVITFGRIFFTQE